LFLLAATLVSALTAADAPRTFSSTPDGTKATAKLPLIAVQGNHFVNPAGETVVFRGLALSDPAALLDRGQWGRRYFE